jgi:hypothetical protein
LGPVPCEYIVAGIDERTTDVPDAVLEGVMVVVDFEVAMFNLYTEGGVQEFP